MRYLIAAPAAGSGAGATRGTPRPGAAAEGAPPTRSGAGGAAGRDERGERRRASDRTPDTDPPGAGGAGRPLPRNADELARDLRFIQMELLMSAEADADGDRTDDDEDPA